MAYFLGFMKNVSKFSDNAVIMAQKTLHTIFFMLLFQSDSSTYIRTCRAVLLDTLVIIYCCK